MKNRLDFKSMLLGVFITIFLINTMSGKRATSKDISPPEKQVIEKPILLDQTNDYLYALALLESSNNYRAARPGSQYIGKYQTGNATRSEIGLNCLNSVDGKAAFLESDILQEAAMIKLLQYQIKQMEPYIAKYDKSRVGKWYVTKSGIIAMAHLMGISNAKRFLDSGGKHITNDGNGRPITDYLQLNNFNIALNSINGDEYFKAFLTAALNK